VTAGLLLSPYLCLRLSVALGVRQLEPLSEGQALAIVRWWMAHRDGGSGDSGLGMPSAGKVREPWWILLTGTVAAKLGRCPANPMPEEIPWRVTAVEARVYVEMALDDEQRAITAARAEIGAEERRSRERSLEGARAILRKLLESRAYRDGVESLRWELAAALQDDGAFRDAIQKRGKDE